MTNLEKLALEIMEDAEKEGEPITIEEATLMAEMELKDKNNRRYEKSDPLKKERKPRERKADLEKKYLIDCAVAFLENLCIEDISVKTETEINFIYNNNNYSFKLIKHRPKN